MTIGQYRSVIARPCRSGRRDPHRLGGDTLRSSLQNEILVAAANERAMECSAGLTRKAASAVAGSPVAAVYDSPISLELG